MIVLERGQRMGLVRRRAGRGQCAGAGNDRRPVPDVDDRLLRRVGARTFPLLPQCGRTVQQPLDRQRPALALADAVADGRLKKGNLVLLASVGAGFTVGSVLLRWSI